VLTKIDKLKSGEIEGLEEAVAKELAKHPAAFPVLALTSSEKKVGIAELRAGLAQLAQW
jgi:GTP-binding protein